ncbi:MAG: sulfatase-like hydrolase/transferase [Limisphaerales bacterium]
MQLILRLTLLLCLAMVSTEAKPPNILFILADDMGYGDTGFMGSKHLKTPHLDALARSGVICSQGYVCSPVCSPSRAGLITGRDPRRFGYEENMNKAAPFYDTRPELLGLAPGEHTLGDHLRAAGYATALIGKWHLGTTEDFHPLERGFDYFCGMLTGGHSYFPDAKKNKLERNREPLSKFSNPYLTDFFTDEAMSWLDRQESKPWFLFASYNAPHGPMQATEADLELFGHISDKRRRTYAAMMFALDRGVGRLRDWLKKNGQLENTLIVFFSDNGGATNNGSWNGKLSGAKGNLREGGVRVPMFWSWPGTLPSGKPYDSPASSLDLLPTFLAAAGAKPLPLRDPMPHEDKRNFNRGVQRFGAYDGINLLPHLKGDLPPKERTLFWRLQGQAAVLDGDDKLIRLSHRPPQLFRPKTDLGETTDLSPSEQGRYESLFRLLGEWEASLPTVPLWGSSPYWISQSAQHYDNMPARPEND